MSSILLACLLFAVGNLQSSSFAQETNVKNDKVDHSPLPSDKVIDEIFEQFDSIESPGLAICVIQDGKIVLDRSYGAANLEHKIPIDSRTSIFNIGSSAKQFTAFAVLLLEDQGLLSLDDSIRKHIPELPQFMEKINLRQLAHHTSGIRSELSLLAMAGWTPGDVIKRDHVLRMLMRQEGLNFDTGSDYSYSNSGYTLLAEVVQRVSGRSFNEFCHEQILRPLGMNNSYFTDGYSRLASNAVTPYGQFSSSFYPLKPNDEYAGSTGLWTTCHDLVKWVDNFHEAKIGSKTVHIKMHDAGKLQNGQSTGYAMGLMIENHRGYQHVQHGGATSGFVSYLGRFPEKNLSVILLGNCPSINARQLSLEVADCFLHEPPTDNDESGTIEKQIQLSNEQLARLTGRYWNKIDRSVSVTQGDNGLIYAIDGGRQIPLRPIGEFDFEMVGTGVNSVVHFEPTKAETFTLCVLQAEREVDRLFRYDENRYAGQNLEQFEGRYYSPELETIYSIESRDGSLVVNHLRFHNIQLIPVINDVFRSSNWRFSTLRFERGSDDQIRGFRLSSMRNRNLRFVKIAADIGNGSDLSEESSQSRDQQDSQDDVENSERKLIEETLVDYIEGSTNGQPDRLRRAFHPDLNLYSIKAGKLSVWSGQDYIKDTKEGKPTGETGKILSIDFENDIAVAKVEISHPRSSVPYIDYFMLLKIEDKWTIIHKSWTKAKSSND